MAVRMKWKLAAFGQLRRSGTVAADLRRRADAVAAACGDGFDANSGQGSTRARAAVVTTTGAAIRQNASDNTILRNLDAGR